jgi:hypothetical protein
VNRYSERIPRCLRRGGFNADVPGVLRNAVVREASAIE